MLDRRSTLALACAAWVASTAGAGLATVRASGARVVLGGRIDRVVALGDGVAVLRAGEVVLVGGDGRVRARCGGTTPPSVAAPHDGTAIAADEVLRLADLSEDDGSPEAEELLDDEGIADRPRRRVDAAVVAPARALSIAGTAEAAWIGTTDGLVRADARTGSCARVALGGRALDVVAASGRAVIAVADTIVWRSDDDGASFRVATVLTSPARSAAVTTKGALTFIADAEGVVELTGGRAARRVLERPTDALIACGDEALALAGGGVYRLASDADVEELGARPPTRALACRAAEEPLVVAAGVGLWTSHDGRTWNEDASVDGIGAPYTDVALTPAGPWLATEAGLRGPALADVAAMAVDKDSFDAATLDVDRRGARPTLAVPPRALPWWSALLPRLTIAFAAWSESQGRAGWHCWALLTFSIDRRARARVNALSEVSP